jgi:peptide-methionine (S)-S-oxide reductase
VDYTLTPENMDFVPEPLFDLQDEKRSLALGWGNYLPGMHELIASMSKGETVSNVQMDAGWGARRDDLVATVSKEASGLSEQDEITEGMELTMSNGMKCIVTNVTDVDFTIDANPPLAGATYLAQVTLVDVADGPQINLEDGTTSNKEKNNPNVNHDGQRFKVATFALGCFWGGELDFMRVPGVVGTKVGYTQGQLDEPTYEQVCQGTTGHTEAMLVVYDSEQVEYGALVKLAIDRLGESKFMLNQVGNDRGTQYRHGVYYHDDEQRQVAQRIIQTYGPDCKTECLPAAYFYDAEDHHQQYLLKGGQSARKGATDFIRCYG